MSTSTCRFCEHRNPCAAHFCNECGSPLALKPCPHCEAIVDVCAGQCHQCGRPFETTPGTEVAAEAGPASTAAADAPPGMAFRLQAADAGAIGAASTPGASIPESLAERLDERSMPHALDGRPEPQRSPAFEPDRVTLEGASADPEDDYRYAAARQRRSSPQRSLLPAASLVRADPPNVRRSISTVTCRNTPWLCATRSAAASSIACRWP